MNHESFISFVELEYCFQTYLILYYELKYI